VNDITVRRWRGRFGDAALVISTGAATLLVLLILAILVIDVIRGGSERLSWGFLTKAPAEGMTAGGVFPAIFGTVAMVVLMTIAVVPAGVATAQRSSRSWSKIRVVKESRVATGAASVGPGSDAVRTAASRVSRLLTPQPQLPAAVRSAVLAGCILLLALPTALLVVPGLLG